MYFKVDKHSRRRETSWGTTAGSPPAAPNQFRQDKLGMQRLRRQFTPRLECRTQQLGVHGVYRRRECTIRSGLPVCQDTIQCLQLQRYGRQTRHAPPCPLSWSACTPRSRATGSGSGTSSDIDLYRYAVMSDCIAYVLAFFGRLPLLLDRAVQAQVLYKTIIIIKFQIQSVCTLHSIPSVTSTSPPGDGSDKQQEADSPASYGRRTSNGVVGCTRIAVARIIDFCETAHSTDNGLHGSRH